MGWNKLIKAALTAVLVVAAAEFIAQAVMARVTFAHCYDHPRNPFYRRAWVPFTEPRPRDANERLIILISNSQGYGSEIPDAQQLYAHQVERMLQQRDPAHRHIVANWSIGGVSGPEMLLLMARAIDHDPDLLLLVTHNDPFAPHRLQHPLEFYLSDAGQLAYLSPIRQRLPAWYLRRYDVEDPSTFLSVHSGLMQIHDTFVETRHGRWEREFVPPPPRKVRRQVGTRQAAQSGLMLLKAAVRLFRQGQPDTPVLLVSMPLDRQRWREAAWPKAAAFARLAQRAVADVPRVTVLDAVSLLDHELFYTHTHMTPQGHSAFARWLLPHVCEQLGLPEQVDLAQR